MNWGIRTILHCCSSRVDVWGSAYCPLIREQNKGKCLEWREWSQYYKEDELEDIIWTDE